MSAKRISATSILLAFTLIASFLAALFPQTISPQSVQAATTVTVYTAVGTTNWTCPTGVTSVEVLVVGGGGAGGGSTVSLQCGGGGGAGGVRYNASYPVSAGTSYTVTVGAGGTGSTGMDNGDDSVFGTITATGGGAGGDRNHAGNNGGSGGGGGLATTTEYAGGSGNTPSTSPSQGNSGARSFYDSQCDLFIWEPCFGCCYWRSGGGGGGAGAAGTEGTKTVAPNGGAGVSTYSDLLILANVGQDIGGVHWIGGGGGGGTAAASPQSSGGNGGGGGGGDFDTGSCIKDGCDATPNTGGGGGGAYSGGSNQVGGDGGSGVVIIRYASLTISAGSGGTITTPAAGAGTYGYSYNKVVDIAASPNSCYAFVNWTGTGVDAGKVANANSASTTITMTDNYSVQANFAITVKTVTYSAGSGGTVNGSWPQNVNCGSDGPWVLATANPSYFFVNWSDSSTTNPRHETNVTSNLSYTANFVANSAPTITSVTLQESGKTGNVGAMAPQTAYVVEIVAGDADTINDINQIDIWIFRDDNAGDDGAPAGAWDADHEAIYRWAKSGSTWSMQNSSATTTWSITTGSCDTPGNMAATSGEWNLYFTVGKLAQESDGSAAEWDVKVTVTDSVAQTVSSTIYSKSMGSYAALSLSAATIDFGSIALGGTAAIQTPVAHYVTLISIANDTFALGSKSSTPWTNGASNANLDVDGSPAATYFSLTQDNAGDGSGHPTTPQYVTTSTVTITDLGSVSRTSTAAGASESTTDTNMYMDCILGASGLKVVTYSGTITFTITNN